MERQMWSSQKKNFWKKQDFLQGSPKFPNGISNGKWMFHLLLATTGISRHFGFYLYLWKMFFLPAEFVKEARNEVLSH